MDTEGMRRYVAAIVDRLEYDGCYEENGIVIRSATDGYWVSGSEPWHYASDRVCAIRCFILRART